MKLTAIGLLGFVLFLAAGCSSTPYLDRKFGKATQASLDQQVAYPNYRFAKKVPEGMVGITAEEVMDIYNKTYAEKPQKLDIFDLQFVPGGGGG